MNRYQIIEYTEDGMKARQSFARLLDAKRAALQLFRQPESQQDDGCGIYDCRASRIVYTCGSFPAEIVGGCLTGHFLPAQDLPECFDADGRRMPQAL